MSFTNSAKSYSKYSALTSYIINDVVFYLNDLYICILATTGNLPTSTTYWKSFYINQIKNNSSWINQAKSNDLGPQ